MNLAKLSANGQITVPVDIRNLLGLKIGDKILFIKNRQGEVVMANASNLALKKVQGNFEGVAEELGLKNDSDVQGLVNEVRYGEKNRRVGFNNLLSPQR